MTAMNDAENDYREVQSDLSKLEKTEQQLFIETMKLTQQQQAELSSKVVELEALLGRRLEQLEQEKASMDKAKASTSELDKIIEKADEQEKDSIVELKKAVEERYAQHTEFVTAYKKLAKLQKELYEMLGAEGTQLTELTDQVDEINVQNDTVKSTVALFNELTEKVNILKDDIFANAKVEK